MGKIIILIIIIIGNLEINCLAQEKKNQTQYWKYIGIDNKTDIIIQKKDAIAHIPLVGINIEILILDSMYQNGLVLDSLTKLLKKGIKPADDWPTSTPIWYVNNWGLYYTGLRIFDIGREADTVLKFYVKDKMEFNPNVNYYDVYYVKGIGIVAVVYTSHGIHFKFNDFKSYTLRKYVDQESQNVVNPAKLKKIKKRIYSEYYYLPMSDRNIKRVLKEL